MPVLQAPVLARALYAHAELDREIPARAVRRGGAGAGLRLPAARRARRPRRRCRASCPTLDVPAELDPHHDEARTPRPTRMNALMQQLQRAARPATPARSSALMAPLFVVHDAGDDGAAAAAVRARPAVHLQHRDGADGDDGRGLHGAAARLRRVPGRAPADDAAAAVAERRLDARRAARGPHRPRRGRRR